MTTLDFAIIDVSLYRLVIIIIYVLNSRLTPYKGDNRTSLQIIIAIFDI